MTQCFFFLGTSEYNTVADIRTSAKGQPNLFIDDQKFMRHNAPNRQGQQRWRCTKETSQKCRAAVTTMMLNGIIMMKIKSPRKNLLDFFFRFVFGMAHPMATMVSFARFYQFQIEYFHFHVFHIHTLGAQQI